MRVYVVITVMNGLNNVALYIIKYTGPRIGLWGTLATGSTEDIKIFDTDIRGAAGKVTGKHL